MWSGGLDTGKNDRQTPDRVRGRQRRAKAGINKSLLDEVGAGRAPFGALAKNCSGFMALVGRRVSRCGYSQTPVGTVGVGAIPLWGSGELRDEPLTT